METERVCIVCGGSLEGKRSDAITDSPACRQKVRRWRKADNRDAKKAIQTLSTLSNALDNPYYKANAATRIQEIYQAAKKAHELLRKHEYQLIFDEGGQLE